MANTNGANTEISTEDLSKRGEELGLDLSNPRYKDLAERNGLLQAPAEVTPVPGEKAETETPEAEEDGGKQTATDPHAEQAGDGEPDSTDERSKWPKGFRKQLSRMERQRDAERADFARKMVEIEQRIENLTKAKATPKAPLKRENFASETEYISAAVREETARVREAEQLEQAKTGVEQAKQTEALNEWMGKINALYPTEAEQQAYQEALAELGDPYQAMSQDMSGYVERSVVGPKILEYLGARLGELQQINRMHPADQIRALQAIAAFVSKPKTVAPKVTKAPGPVGKLGAGSGSKSAGEMSQRELLEYYRKHRKMPGE